MSCINVSCSTCHFRLLSPLFFIWPWSYFIDLPPTSSRLSLHILFFFYFPSHFRSKDPVSVQCFLIHISWYPIVLSFIRPSHIFAPLAPYNGGYSTSDNASDKEISTAVAAGGSINLHTQKSHIIVKKSPIFSLSVSSSTWQVNAYCVTSMESSEKEITGRKMRRSFHSYSAYYAYSLL